MSQQELRTVTDRPGDPEVAATAPVFVDSTGRRARWLRVLSVALCLVFLAYLGALAGGLFGSSVDLSTAMPSVAASASASATAG